MRSVVKLNADYLHLRVIHDDPYLESLENHLLTHGLTMPIFVTHGDVIGEYDVLVQCDVIQALLNLHSRWTKDHAIPVPLGVYVRDRDDWYIDVAAGTWNSRDENPRKEMMSEGVKHRPSRSIYACSEGSS